MQTTEAKRPPKRKPPIKHYPLFTMRSTPELRAELDQLSEKLNVPKAEIVRRAVAQMAQTA